MPVFLALFGAFLLLPVLWPDVDLLISGLFYRAGDGFFLSDNFIFEALHFLANTGARVLGVALLVFTLVTWLRYKGKGSIAKSGLFLFFALLIGPGLVANVGLKDHWGRSRPREIINFGGSEEFSPALMPQFDKARKNGSFVSGDGAFGFFLPVFAYVAPRRLARRVFWGGMVAGVAFGFSRLAVGAHFFSDVVYAAFSMLAVCAGLYAAMFGVREAGSRWRIFLGAPSTREGAQSG